MTLRKLFALVVLLVLATSVSAQNVSDNFSTFSSEWVAADSDWAVQAGALVNYDPSNTLARIDRMVPHSGMYRVEFEVTYNPIPNNGYDNERAMANNQFHAGFGIHLGVKEAPLGKPAWSVGSGYLFWLNLETRDQFAAEYPQHAGFRAELYNNDGGNSMELAPANRAIRNMYGTDAVSLNLPSALGVSLADMLNYVAANMLSGPVKISMVVNADTGEIAIQDPTNPAISFTATVDPSRLSGNYISLRANHLSLRFDNFRFVQL